MDDDSERELDSKTAHNTPDNIAPANSRLAIACRVPIEHFEASSCLVFYRGLLFREVMQRAALLLIGVFFTSLFLACPVHAHEQKDYTIILGSSANSPQNASALLVGDAAFFRMEDSRENFSHNVTVDIDRDGDFDGDDWSSGELVISCETDENGSRIEDSCNKTARLVFNLTSDVGNYSFIVELSDGEIRYGNITISPDIHIDDSGPSMGYCIGSDCDENDVSDEVSSSESEGFDRERLLLALAVLMGGAGVFLLMSGNSTPGNATEEE